MMAGALCGLVSATLGGVLPRSDGTTSVVLARFLGLLFLAELKIGGLSVPQLRARVPRAIWRLSPLAMAAVWGTVLGFGALTFVKFGCYWALHGILVSQRNRSLGILAGALYGFCRTLPILASRWMGRPSEDFQVSLGVLDRFEPSVHAINAGVLLCGLVLTATKVVR